MSFTLCKLYECNLRSYYGMHKTIYGEIFSTEKEMECEISEIR